MEMASPSISFFRDSSHFQGHSRSHTALSVGAHCILQDCGVSAQVPVSGGARITKSRITKSRAGRHGSGWAQWEKPSFFLGCLAQYREAMFGANLSGESTAMVPGNWCPMPLQPGHSRPQPHKNQLPLGLLGELEPHKVRTVSHGGRGQRGQWQLTVLRRSNTSTMQGSGRPHTQNQPGNLPTSATPLLFSSAGACTLPSPSVADQEDPDGQTFLANVSCCSTMSHSRDGH